MAAVRPPLFRTKVNLLPNYISPAGVVEMIPGMTEKHLSQLRHKGGGPLYFKPTPKIVLYRAEDVVQWVESSIYVRTNLLAERSA